jgi:hypothetical protein
MRRRSQRQQARMPGLLSRLVGAVCGRTQRLITAGPSLPLVVATYPRQNGWLAAELSNSLRFTFPALTEDVKKDYCDALARGPAVVVAELRLANVCRCLGHHHPEVLHSPLTKSLQADTGGSIGEIDLAVGSIRKWNPLPLASLAAACNESLRDSFEEVRFHAALLAVFLHELEHMVYPDRAEDEIRSRSNRFYVDAVGELLGIQFGLASDRSPNVLGEQPRFA